MEDHDYLPEQQTMRRLVPPGNAWAEAAAVGFDLSLLELSLRLTPDERVRQHDSALNLALALREAMRKRDGRL